MNLNIQKECSGNVRQSTAIFYPEMERLPWRLSHATLFRPNEHYEFCVSKDETTDLKQADILCFRKSLTFPDNWWQDKWWVLSKGGKTLSTPRPEHCNKQTSFQILRLHKKIWAWGGGAYLNFGPIQATIKCAITLSDLRSQICCLVGWNDCQAEEIRKSDWRRTLPEMQTILAGKGAKRGGG